MGSSLTNDSKINFAVACLSHFEVHSASVHGLVGLPDVVYPELCRLFLWHEVGPVCEHIFVGPPVR